MDLGRERERILGVELNGLNIVMVKLLCVLLSGLFTSRLNLVKVDGAWRIINKSCRAEALPAETGDSKYVLTYQGAV